MRDNNQAEAIAFAGLIWFMLNLKITVMIGPMLGLSAGQQLAKFIIHAALQAFLVYAFWRTLPIFRENLSGIAFVFCQPKGRLLQFAMLGVFAVMVITLLIDAYLREKPLEADNPYWVHLFAFQNRTGLESQWPKFLSYMIPLGLTDCVILPVMEEVVFVGVLQSVLSRRMPGFAAILVVTVLFVLVHAINRAGLIGLSYVVFLVCWRVTVCSLFYWSGNLAVPITAHILWNTFVAAHKIVPQLL
jgi:membrane protease YdiL (CAAX protease family)